MTSTEGDMEGRRTRNDTENAILHAACAGSLRAAARRHPEARPGLHRGAAFHSERAAEYAALICAEAALDGQASARIGR